MTGMLIGNFMALAQNINLSIYNTFLDAAGSAGVLSFMVVRHNLHMHSTTFYLPQV